MCVCACERVGGADIREKVCLISALFSLEQLSGTGCRNKKKHLIPPICLPLTKHLQWLENQWLAESPEHHQISMLIASGLTSAVPGWGTLGEGLPHETRVRSTPMLKAPLVTEQKTIIICTHHNYSYSMLVIQVFNMDNRSSTSKPMLRKNIHSPTYINLTVLECINRMIINQLLSINSIKEIQWSALLVLFCFVLSKKCFDHFLCHLIVK